MQQQQDQNDPMNWKRNFNVVFNLCLMHQRALIVTLRNKFGPQALGTSSAFALVMMVLWWMFTRDPFMLVWIGLWGLCFVKRRVESAALVAKGVTLHSQYDGWPFDAIRFGRTEKAAKLIVEPIIVAIFGGMLWWAYGRMGWPRHGLPKFILTGCFTLPFVELVKQNIWENRLRGMQDARLEQEALVKESHRRFSDS